MKKLLAPVVLALVLALANSAGLGAANGVTWAGDTDRTVSAVDANGATATFDVTATDASNNPLQVTCVPASGALFPLGATPVQCTASDGTNTLDTTGFTVTVADTTPPDVTAPSDVATTTADPSGTAVSYGAASATDNVDGSVPATCTPTSGSPFPVGHTTVTCKASDTANNTGTATFSVTVTLVDTTKPVVTVPTNIVTTTSDPAGKTVTFSASANDNVDGPLTPTCTPASGSLFVVGTTSVSCSATDSHGNTGSAGFSVTVNLVDVTPPVVTVPGPLNVTATGPSTPVGFLVSATDNIDGTDPVSCNHAPGSGFPVGTTTVGCSSTDRAGNTGSASFTVTVVDRTPPVVSVPVDQSVAATSPGGAVVTYSAQATDNVDGLITPSCIPASGSTFPAKVTTTVTCTATDSGGNSSSRSFKVTVNDSAPTITHVADVVAEANGPSGAAVTYTPPSATDVVDGGLAVQCLPASGAVFSLGATTVNCSATNSSGQTSTSSFGVRVRDTTPPTLGVPGTISLTSDAPVPATNSLVAQFLDDRATDLVDPSPHVSTNAPSVFPFGSTTVVFTAVDASGNSTTATGTVVVVRPTTSDVAPLSPVVTPGTTVPERTPPANVQKLTITLSGRSALLRWKLPAGDFDHLAILRAAGSAKPVTIYRGRATRFVDHRLVPGVEYRYLIVTFDHAGNQSTGVVALAHVTPQRLFGPANGQRVAVPVVMRWQAAAGASFYNVQIFRAGKKVYSSWPTTAKLVLGARWTYAGRTQQLLPGRYTWYVWPAHGTRSKPKYQPLEGFSTFVVVAT